MTDQSFWSLATRGTLANVRVLARALAREHPGRRLTVLLAGPPTGEDEPFDVLSLRDVDPALVDDVRVLPWTGMALVARAALLQHALRAGPGPAVLLDPELDVHAALTPLIDRVTSRRPVVVLARTGDLPPEDGARPTRKDLGDAGLIVPSAVVAMPSPEADAILRWWREHVRNELALMTPVELAELRAGPSSRLARWLDLTPSRYDAVTVVEDPAIGASAWNLHERSLTLGAGGFEVDGSPLVLADLAGFDPAHPYWLSAAGDRVRVPGDPALRALCTTYAQALRSAGWRPETRVGQGTRLPSGLLFDDRIDRVHQAAALGGEDLGDPRTHEGADRLERWLAGPARRGALHGINRYTEAIWDERPDVAALFADLDGDDGQGFVEWLWAWGREEMGIPDRFLPPRPGRPAGEDRPAPTSRPPAVHITGFMRGALGLGAAARLYVTAVEAAGLEVSTTTVAPPHAAAGGIYAEVDFEDTGGSAHRRDVDLVCVNADEFPAFVEQSGGALEGAGRRIGIWAWETDHIPERWRMAYPLVDEIWTYTRFVAESISRVAPVPVIPVPIPVTAPEPGGATVDLGVPDGFRFLFAFDFLSTPARKNPEGVIEAFTRAFGPGEGPQLVIKTLHGDLRPRALDRLRWLAEGRPDVHIVDLSLTNAERDALMAGCDCYVSLHRAEGFGLTLAEAMAIGKPVIGTGYSGNLDFMTPMNSYLVEYDMTLVGPEGEHYPAEGTWADPRLDHAAALMRRVVEQPDEARTKGERARSDIAAQLSPAAVGRIIRARLEALAGFGEAP